MCFPPFLCPTLKREHLLGTGQRGQRGRIDVKMFPERFKYSEEAVNVTIRKIIAVIIVFLLRGLPSQDARTNVDFSQVWI